MFEFMKFFDFHGQFPGKKEGSISFQIPKSHNTGYQSSIKVEFRQDFWTS